MFNKPNNPIVKYFDTRTEHFQPINGFMPARKALPEWYRKAPTRAPLEGDQYTFDGEHFVFDPEKADPKTQYASTFKHCMPVLDSMTMGYVVTLGEDVVFNEDAQMFEESEEVQQGGHFPFEMVGYPTPDWCHPKLYKWNSWWRLELPEGYSGLFMHPLHRTDLPFYTLPGLVDTDVHPLEVNTPFMMRKGFSGTIPAGTPVFQMIPFKRENWKSEEQEPQPVFGTSIVTDLFKFNKYGFAELGAYKKKVRTKKNFD